MNNILNHVSLNYPLMNLIRRHVSGLYDIRCRYMQYGAGIVCELAGLRVLLKSA